jgi:c-di-GMP-binding flagellar brake protein YcgR
MLPLLSRISVYFYDENNQSYRFNSRVSKYASGRSETIMVLAHTDKVEILPNRQHDRKDVRTPCNFVHVSVANVINGKHTEHKFYPSGKPLHGTMCDFSAGGCSFTTKFPPGDGEYIELSCILDGTIEDKMIGKVVNTNRDKDEPEVHVRFAKMPRASMNRIFAYVYSSGERGK